ncbi:MAG: hypothetical protein ACTSRA_09075 [Promethearchaeota archaeon]
MPPCIHRGLDFRAGIPVFMIVKLLQYSKMMGQRHQVIIFKTKP